MTRGPATYWRYHARPRVPTPRLERAARRNAPFTETVARLLKTLTARARTQGLPAPSFPFGPGEVAQIASDDGGAEETVWFILKDGRVFDAVGEPATMTSVVTTLQGDRG